eukprot:330498-Hanusia_phi.AAC.1
MICQWIDLSCQCCWRLAAGRATTVPGAGRRAAAQLSPGLGWWSIVGMWSRHRSKGSNMAVTVATVMAAFF